MRFRLLCARLSVLSLALLLSSCALVGVPRRVAFNEAEFAPYRGAGSGTVAGQLVVTAEDDGEVHVSNGDHVTLLPVTSYTKEMVDREIGDGELLASSDPRLQQYVRLTTTDAGGNFVFNHIPAGEYFVAGLDEWYFGNDAQYQWACDRVTVGKGQTVRIKLSKISITPAARIWSSGRWNKIGRVGPWRPWRETKCRAISPAWLRRLFARP